MGQLQKAVRHCNRTQIPYRWSRLPDHRAAKVAMSWTPADGRRKTGRPKKTRRRTFQQDLQRVDFKWEEVEYVATDRSKWRQAAARCAQGTVWTKSKDWIKVGDIMYERNKEWEVFWWKIISKLRTSDEKWNWHYVCY